MLQNQQYLNIGQPLEVKPLSANTLSSPTSPQNINLPTNYFHANTNLNSVNSNLNHQQRIISKPTSVQFYPVASMPNQYINPQNHIITQNVHNIGANNAIVNNNFSGMPPQLINYQPTQLYQRITTNTNKIPTRPSYHFFGSQIRQNNYKSASPALETQTHQVHMSQPISGHSHSQQARYANSSNVHFSYKGFQPQQNTFAYHQQTRIPQPQTRIIQSVPVVPVQPIQHLPPQPQVYIQNHLPPLGMPQMIPNQIVQYDNRQIVTTTTIVWEHRFVQIYSKFQIFVEKFETIVEEIYYIDDLFDNVNDQEAWNDLRVKYTEVIDKFNEMREEIILVLEQNKAAINSLSPEVVKQLEQRQQEQEQHYEGKHQQHQEENQQVHEEGGITGQSENDRIWENRYLELMQHHEALSQQNMAIKAELDRLRMQPNNDRKPRDSERDNIKLMEMQKNLNTIHVEYQKLEDNYAKLSQEYSRVLNELQNGGREGGSSEISELQQQLEMADAKIQELYTEIQNKNQHIIALEKETQSGGQILDQNKTLIETINKLHQDLELYANELKKKDEMLQQYDNEVKNLHEQMMQMSHALEQFQNFQQPTQINPLQYQRKLQEIQALQEKQKSLLNMIQKHEQSIEEMALKNQKLSIDFEAISRDKQEQIRMFQNLLEQQRAARQRILSQGSTIHSSQRHQNITQTSVFKQRLQIEIEEIVAEKNRKIKSLTHDLEDLKQQIQAMEKDKAKSIKQIKDYFAEQEEKYVKKIQDKDNNLKLLNEKIKSFETQLSSRNLEISRFRAQSPVNSFNTGNEQSKRFNEAIERKNHEMQQLRRSLQKKSLQIKEFEQKIFALQQELNSKIFQINSLKRQIFDLHGNRAQIDNLNNIIKKKNQQINELRLSSIEIDQLKLNYDGLERQKIRLNEYLKEKTRECESKDSTIQSLERKLNAYSFEAVGVTSRKYTSDFDKPTNSIAVNNYESLLRQKETQIKNLKYELEMIEAKVGISQKTIRDLNNKISNNQRSSSVAKAQIQNKISKYETEIKELNKQIRNLKANKQQLTNIIESMQTKNSSLSKSLDQRNSIYDSQLRSNKFKISQIEKQNTLLLVDQEVLKGEIERLNQENRDLNNKIKLMQDKIQSKNKAINEIKGSFEKKEKEDIKIYEQKIKKLDSELKFSTVKLKNMEEEIAKLNKKIASAENQKRSYRERLITESSNDKPEFIDFRYASQHYDYGPQEVLEMERFKLKDPNANNVFERKVIYDLKRENDMLRKELSGVGMGIGSYSMNRIETQHNRFSTYQQEAYTDRDQEPERDRDDQHNIEILSYHKSKNKELEDRVDELLRVNKQLNEKLRTMNQSSASQFSIAFFKQQMSKLESDNAKLEAKIKQILSDHESYQDELTGHQHESESLKTKVNDQNAIILELKNTIKTKQETIVQLENTREICLAEIDRLKQMNEKKDKFKQVISQKERSISDFGQQKESSLRGLTAPSGIKLSHSGPLTHQPPSRPI